MDSHSNLEGEWKTGGPSRMLSVGAPCRIYSEGGSLYVLNEKGSAVRAQVLDQETILAEWQGGLYGYISDNGKRINWANGTWWVR